MCVYTYMCTYNTAFILRSESSSLLWSCGSQRLNSGYQTWRQVPSPAEPFCVFCSFEDCVCGETWSSCFRRSGSSVYSCVNVLIGRIGGFFSGSWVFSVPLSLLGNQGFEVLHLLSSVLLFPSYHFCSVWSTANRVSSEYLLFVFMY